jgi:hypothetical protein
MLRVLVGIVTRLQGRLADLAAAADAPADAAPDPGPG